VANCARVQEYHGTRIVSAEAGIEKRALGAGIGGLSKMQQQGKSPEEL